MNRKQRRAQPEKKAPPPAADLFGHALHHHRAGRLGDAERLYRQILAADKHHADALHMLGGIAYQIGRAEAALDLISKAIAINGKEASYRYNRALVLQALRRLPEAAGDYQRAIRLKPDYAEAHGNLGNVLRDLGRLEDAAGAYGAALRLRPDYAEAHNNLGSTLAALGRLDEAIRHYGAAIRLQPAYVEAQANLGLALQNSGRFEEAARHYGEAVRLRPGHAEALAQQIHCLQQACDWPEIGRLQRDLLTRDEKFSPFIALTIDSSAEQQLVIAKTWSRQSYGHIKPLPQPPRPPGEKIRLGYLSADYCNHPVGHLVADLIERHDRRHFEVIGYSYGPDDGSAIRRRLMRAFDRFVDLRQMPNEEAARLIQRDGIDILVDLTGYTTKARTEILAYRPAPLQVNFLGYPATMGADFIDWIIADPICIPPDQEGFFSETVVRLADCYQPNDGQRQIAEETPTRARCGLPEQGTVFCCFNNSYKITPAIFAIWMRLLGKVAASVLWLLETNEAAKNNLRREAAAAGIAPERLVFAPRLPLPDHLARHRLADLFLDTLPYNAHTTASDALWSGLPVLTCLGETFAGRVAASLLSAIGMDELITRSAAKYEALALALAADPARLAGIKAKLAAHRPTAPLFDGERFARSIESAFRRGPCD